MKAKLPQVLLMFLGAPDDDAQQVVLDGFSKGASLALPPGDVFAADGIQYASSDRVGRSVMPLFDEAYVIVKLQDGARWYATWCPYAGEWETQCTETWWFRSNVEDAARALDSPNRYRLATARSA